MKRLSIVFLAAAAVFAACTKFAEDAEITYASIEAPEVTATAVSDSAVTMTLEPKQGTAYYSYVVAEGAATKVNPVNLLKGKSGLKALVVNEKEMAAVIEVKAEAVEDTKATATLPLGKLTFELTDLKPNTKYTIYAVASNDQGVVSELATATALTTDRLAPSVIKRASEEADSVLTIAVKFDDPVVLGENPEVNVNFYAENYYDENFVIQKLATIRLTDSENVFVAGGVLYVSIPKEYYTPGALVDITWSEGLVTNQLGAPCPAFEYEGFSYDADNNYALVVEGIDAQYEYVDFEISYFESEEEEDQFKGEDEEDAELETVYFTDWEALEMVSYARASGPLAYVGSKAKLSITAVEESGRTVSYTSQDIDVDGDEVYAYLAEDPLPGTMVSYTIAAGSIYDMFGNKNKEFTVEDVYFCSYGNTMEDVIGTFSAIYLDGRNQLSGPVELTIAESNDPTKGNVMITNYFGIPCLAPIYASFDPHRAKLVIPEWQLFGIALGKYYLYHSSYNEEDLVLRMYEPGVLSDASDAFGAYAMDAATGKGAGYYLFIAAVQAKKVADEVEGTSQTQSSVSLDFNLPEGFEGKRGNLDVIEF